MKRVMSRMWMGTLVDVNLRKGCVKDDMRIKEANMEMNDRREWKKETCCANPA
jgi:hypothetical protein